MFMDYFVFSTNMVDTVPPYWFIVGKNGIINGLDEGVRYMKLWGKTRFLTPSNLAYGPAGLPPVIPGFIPLLWDVELVSVRPGPGK
jgi:FKBP-type peptidyl-prolyl cis-trans isomerase